MVLFLQEMGLNTCWASTFNKKNIGAVINDGERFVIMEPYYGCGERPDGYVAMNTVLLRDAEGQETEMEVSDEELYRKDINEGDWVSFDVNNVIFKE